MVVMYSVLLQPGENCNYSRLLAILLLYLTSFSCLYLGCWEQPCVQCFCNRCLLSVGFISHSKWCFFRTWRTYSPWLWTAFDSVLKKFKTWIDHLGCQSKQIWDVWFLPSGNLLHSYWKWPFIVDLPIEHGGSFHSYVNVYQRVFHFYR